MEGPSSEMFMRQRNHIVQCACKCFETKGVHKTSLADIAREAGITRELIYYYLSGKNEIIDCVCDLYVEDAIDTIMLWCDDQVSSGAVDRPMDGTLRTEAIRGLIGSIRRFVFTNNGEYRPMFTVLAETSNKSKVMANVCDGVRQKLENHPAAGFAQTLLPALANDPNGDILKFFAFGVVGLMDIQSFQNDEPIVALITNLSKTQQA